MDWNQGSSDTYIGVHNGVGDNGPSRGTGGHRAEGHGFGLVLFASALLIVIGDLARAANLLAGALMVRLICAFVATPGPARPGHRARAAPGWPDEGACMWQCTKLGRRPASGAGDDDG
jgi:hypothetical protein